jgi:hypothetical protein
MHFLLYFFSIIIYIFYCIFIVLIIVFDVNDICFSSNSFTQNIGTGFSNQALNLNNQFTSSSNTNLFNPGQQALPRNQPQFPLLNNQTSSDFASQPFSSALNKGFNMNSNPFSNSLTS